MSHTVTHNKNTGFFSVFNDFIEEMKRKREIRRKINQTIRELHSLSDRELSDLGLNRSMIRQVAMEPYYDNH
jgi:uncharacterized protein YjiS (DUF1127 family)